MRSFGMWLGAMTCAVALVGPGECNAQISKEYVRISGRLEAIESPGVDNFANESVVGTDIPANVNVSTAFSATVRIRNTGTTTWDAANYRLQAQGSTGADFGISGPINFPAGTSSVAPNGVVAFTVNGTARATTCASCPFQFVMAKSGVGFGTAANHTINIIGSIVVSVTPSTSVTLNRGQTASFTASVTNAASNVLSWTNPAQGSFQSASTTSGGANVYTAPSAAYFSHIDHCFS